MAEIQLTNLQTKQRDGRDTTHKPNYKQPDTTHKTTNSRMQLTKLQTTIYKSQNYKQRYGRDTTHNLQKKRYNSQTTNNLIQLIKLQTTRYNSQNYKTKEIQSGLGRVLDKIARGQVQIQVHEQIMNTSTSTSAGFSKVLEY